MTQIAIPVEEQSRKIFFHTGRAPQFAIFEKINSKFEFIKYMDNPKHDHGHNHSHDHDHGHSHSHGNSEEDRQHRNEHSKQLSSLQKGDILAVLHIGPHMARAAHDLGIKIVRYAKEDVVTAEDLLEKLSAKL